MQLNIISKIFFITLHQSTNMKFYFTIIILCFVAYLCYSQQYGNEWINYNQKYFKVPIYKTGLHRISRQALVAAGFPINNIHPKNIQMFAKGKELCIYVHGEDDGIFNNTDYIEFYAEANDGWYDSLLYKYPEKIANPYYSLFNDTINYFLTWNQSQNNCRAIFELDTNFSQYQSATHSFCYVEKLIVKSDYYYYGDIGCWYNRAEGWSSYFADINQPISISISTPNYAAVSLPSYISFLSLSASNASFTSGGNHHLGFYVNNSLIFDTIFIGLQNIEKHLTYHLPLSSTTSFVLAPINDLNLVTDKLALSYIKLRYPHQMLFNASKYKFFLENHPSSNKSLIEIQQPSSAKVILWDITNNRKIYTKYETGVHKALIPNGQISNKHIYYCVEDSIIYANVLPGKIYTNYLENAQNADYIIITHPSLNSSVAQYANYRNQTGYQTLITDVTQLYEQFSYGINKHPLGIKNFIRLLYNQYGEKIKHILIIGKGIRNEMYRKNISMYSQNLVPTYGTPPSDQYFTSNIQNRLPLYSIGRIAATSNNDVILYLNKVIQYETSEPANWQKRILHFGGGLNTSEQQMIETFLISLENIIEDTLYGGFVQTFLKTTSLPIQITVSDSIRHLINDGCSILNFFGHGTSGGFDQNIDEPSTYNNQGRYPLLFANTCLSGDIYLPDYKRIAERWVLIPDKGAIAFLASTDLGIASQLYVYSQEFYKQITYKNFAKPIGHCIKETIKEVISQNGWGPYIENTCYDYALHGDPAIKMHVKDLPDLTIHSSDIQFFPSNITNDIDTFELSVVVTNYGKAFISPYVVEVKRTFTNGQQATISKIRQKCLYKDTVVFRIPVDFVNGSGNNQFCVIADALGWIEEYNENNNKVCVNKFISVSDIIPIYPYEFAIYPNDSVTLIASTGYPFLPSLNYIFEIDTTDLFNSPFKKVGYVSQLGGIVAWKPPIMLVDCTVYYWRVALNSNTPNWKESSFIYIPSKTGWSQAHFFQFKKNRYRFINYNRSTRTFEFITTPKELHCQTMGVGAASSYFDYFYNLDNIIERSSCSPNSAILAVVIDPLTIEPWTSDKANYGHVNYPVCPPKLRSDYYFTFFSTSQGLNSLNTFLKDSVPNGHYILLYNFIYGNFQQWPEILYQTLESMGAVQIRAVPNDGAYIFFAKKGDFSSVIEKIGDNNDTLILDIEIPVNYFNGHIFSTLIGPSSNWKTLHWLPKSNEQPTKDYEYISLTAYKANFDSVQVIPVMTKDTLDLYNLQDYADASIYPYLRLTFYTHDDSLKTPTQLKRWQITFDGVPETAISPNLGYYFYKDTLQEGETIKFAVATKNISPYDMDSLLVRYWIYDKNNNIVPLAIKRLRKHPANDLLIDTIKFSTKGLPGLNYLWYEVNCVNPTFGTYDQLEQYHFNNYAVKSFYVQTDKINPLLDVTFDGVRILDGDIVSARPNIVIQLKDENKFLVLNDTSIFAIYLTDLKTNIEKRIYFNNSENPLLFYPAQLPHNICKVEYKPVLNDGTYMLRIQAKDMSNNISGYYDYTITFRVVNKQAISNVLNYPNPFSTSTRFVFTLTGYEVPDDIRVEIYTISGRLVRTIRKDELGHIHIGRNITQYVWDGTDDYGDKLANGVYFYRVVARHKGKAVEHIETEVDKYFKEGFGKMYILR